MFSSRQIATACLARINCIHLRNIRQDLRSSVFASTYLFLLGVGAFAALLAAWAANEGAREAGPVMFGAMGVILSLVLWLLQALTTVRATVREREDSTWELVQLSGINPGTIVRGLWLAGLQNALFAVAALAPFMCMAWLLRGLDLVTVIGAIVATVLVACTAQAWAVLIGSLPLRKARRQSVNAIFSLAFGILWGCCIPMWFTVSQWAPEVLNEINSEPLLATSVILLWINIAVWLVILPLVLAKNQCKDAAEDRSSGPRFAWFLTLVNGWIWALIFGLAIGLDRGDILAEVDNTLLAIALISLVWSLLHVFDSASENAMITPRQANFSEAWRQKGRHGRFLMKSLGWFLQPGQGGGIRSSTVALIIAPLIVLLCFAIDEADGRFLSSRTEGGFAAILYWQAYGTFILGMGLGFSYILPEQAMTPSRRRATCVGVAFLLAIFFPILIMMAGTNHDEALSPFFHDDWDSLRWIMRIDGGLMTLIAGGLAWGFFIIRGWFIRPGGVASLKAGPGARENAALLSRKTAIEAPDKEASSNQGSDNKEAVTQQTDIAKNDHS